MDWAGVNEVRNGYKSSSGINKAIDLEKKRCGDKQTTQPSDIALGAKV
jgi:hypothetical protein